MSDKVKTILFRFLRGAVSGAVSSMIVITPVAATNFDDLKPWIIALAIAATIGIITGGLQALDKALRWNE